MTFTHNDKDVATEMEMVDWSLLLARFKNTLNKIWSNYSDLTQPGPILSGGLVREVPGHFKISVGEILLGGGFKDFSFLPLLGEMTQFDEYFSIG